MAAQLVTPASCARVSCSPTTRTMSVERAPTVFIFTWSVATVLLSAKKCNELYLVLLFKIRVMSDDPLVVSDRNTLWSV